MIFNEQLNKRLYYLLLTRIKRLDYLLLTRIKHYGDFISNLFYATYFLHSILHGRRKSSVLSYPGRDLCPIESLSPTWCCVTVVGWGGGKVDLSAVTFATCAVCPFALGT